MARNIFLILATLILAVGILFTSIARNASVKYVFQAPSENYGLDEVLGDTSIIDYPLPYPGKVLPDSTLWSLKAFRDKIWILVTPSKERKAELHLLFADKRLVMARLLFERDKPGIAFSTLTKAEKYLENALNLAGEAKEGGVNTNKLYESIVNASLKHQEEMNKMQKIAPDDAKPQIITVKENYAERVYERAREALYEQGITPPQNPFDGQ